MNESTIRPGILLLLQILLLASWPSMATAQDRCFGFGLPTDQPATGDWNGDGRDEVAIFRDGHWGFDYNGNGLWDGIGPGNDRTYNGFGQTGDLPVAGDWNGDGLDEIGIFRDGSWILDLNGIGILNGCGVDICAGFGQPGDVPAVGDWNGDGKDQIGVFRNGTWFLDFNGNRSWDGAPTDLTFGFGLPGDRVAVGDWNDDGRDEVGVFRAGGWSLDANGNQQWDGPGGGDWGFLFGTGSEIPVPGNWSDSPADEPGLFLNASWRLDQNANHTVDACTSNVAPVAAPDKAFLYRGRSVRIGVLANDHDPNGQSLTVTQILRDVDHGQTTILPNGEVLYQPFSGYVGQDSFRYEVTDSVGGFGVAEVSISVRQDSAATRQRPTFQNGSLLSDRGDLLRGAFWNTDLNGGTLPNQAQVTAMRDQGFNALHLYAEAWGCGHQAGDHLGQVMILNDWVKSAGLYLIVTIGNGDGGNPNSNVCTSLRENGEHFDIDFARDFWRHYAQAFADEPQVILELYNEIYHQFIGAGFLRAQPSPEKSRQLEAAAYLAAREYAPNSPILLFSYGTLHDLQGVLDDWANVETKVQNAGGALTNVGLAFHGYTFPKDNPAVAYPILESTIRGLQDLGYPLVMTENRTVRKASDCVVSGQMTATPCIDAQMIHLLERQDISWTSFLRLGQLSGTGFDQRFRAQIDYGIAGDSVVWAADFGIWPARLAPPTAGANVLLKSRANNKWVSTSRSGLSPGAGPLTADRSNGGGWETFVVENHSGDQICLKSRVLANGAFPSDPYVDPRWTSVNTALLAHEDACAAQLAFDWLVLPNGDVVLKAPFDANSAIDRPSWRYVTVDTNATYPELFDRSTLVGANERFGVSTKSQRGN